MEGHSATRIRVNGFDGDPNTAELGHRLRKFAARYHPCGSVREAMRRRQNSQFIDRSKSAVR